MHSYMLCNDEILPAGSRTMSPGQVGAVNGWGVFSTLRVHQGVLFAWERHYARMHRDAKLMRVPFPEDSLEFQKRLLRLVEANDAIESTLRVIVLRNQGGMWEGPGIQRPYEIIAFTTSLKNWGDSVRLGWMPQARHAANHFAGAKMLSWSTNLCYYEQAHDEGYDEVVLLNERGEVSELTSANLFVVQGNRVLTPGLNSGCLPGVTRAILLEDIQVPGLEIAEATLGASDLESADEIFITSSTRDLLPVREIATLSIRNRGNVRPQLNAAFQAYLKGYCENYSDALRARSGLKLS